MKLDDDQFLILDVYSTSFITRKTMRQQHGHYLIFLNIINGD